jgi:hypothetical protein
LYGRPSSAQTAELNALCSSPCRPRDRAHLVRPAEPTLPGDIRAVALRKLRLLNQAWALSDLRVPPPKKRRKGANQSTSISQLRLELAVMAQHIPPGVGRPSRRSMAGHDGRIASNSRIFRNKRFPKTESCAINFRCTEPSTIHTRRAPEGWGATFPTHYT